MLLPVPVLAQDKASSGPFDYYVLSLSWSPTWCGTKAGRGDAEQCGAARGYGFVVHGLWPQYGRGGYPSECAVAQPLPPSLVDAMLPIMPSRQLVQHEWKKHGTCASASPSEYFGKTRAAFERVRIPKLFQAPALPQTLPVVQVEKLFQAANPGLESDAISVVCRGHHAAEVRVCLNKDLSFRPCARDVRDRCKGDALFPAAR
ncbi:MAG: ribonuclease T2 [Magnetospirillum sp.]|nr:ribonuclease T2 [Magnetospirillum sp.]